MEFGGAGGKGVRTRDPAFGAGCNDGILLFAHSRLCLPSGLAKQPEMRSTLHGACRYAAFHHAYRGNPDAASPRQAPSGPGKHPHGGGENPGHGGHGIRRGGEDRDGRITSIPGGGDCRGPAGARISIVIVNELGTAPGNVGIRHLIAARIQVSREESSLPAPLPFRVKTGGVTRAKGKSLRNLPGFPPGRSPLWGRPGLRYLPHRPLRWRRFCAGCAA